MPRDRNDPALIVVARCESLEYGNWTVFYDRGEDKVYHARDDMEILDYRPYCLSASAFDRHGWSSWFVPVAERAMENVVNINAGWLARHIMVERLVGDKPKPMVEQEKPWYLKTGAVDLEYERSE
jgi:hypothetical protein